MAAGRGTLLGAELQNEGRADVAGARQNAMGKKCEAACGHGMEDEEVWWCTRYDDEGSKILGCGKGFLDRHSNLSLEAIAHRGSSC